MSVLSIRISLFSRQLPKHVRLARDRTEVMKWIHKSFDLQNTSPVAMYFPSLLNVQQVNVLRDVKCHCRLYVPSYSTTVLLQNLYFIKFHLFISFVQSCMSYYLTESLINIHVCVPISYLNISICSTVKL
jgi:hypothetical protein